MPFTHFICETTGERVDPQEQGDHGQTEREGGERAREEDESRIAHMPDRPLLKGLFHKYEGTPSHRWRQP